MKLLTNVPDHYLECNGATYNISDYPKLAEHIKKDFGSYNYFGGDGTTTFAVPDLRGEFLRGSGTNSHTNQGSGANVGTHQDATEHLAAGIWDNTLYTGGTTLSRDDNNQIYNADSQIAVANAYDRNITVSVGGSRTYNRITSRPTNTSVMYAIRYE